MFEELFSIDNLFYAWKKFKKGKSRRKDVIEFEYSLENNIFTLHADIISGIYRHGGYTYFQVFDSKKRDIYKACIRDRIVHQAMYQYLHNVYNPIFIVDSYSSRTNKGNLKAVAACKYFIKLCSSHNSKKCFVLKCDIKKYFENIDHQILIKELSSKITCKKVLLIAEDIIESFPSDNTTQKGIPLGNITSQIFANIYLHTLDIYIKNVLNCRYYARYNDDFVIINPSEMKLIKIREDIIKYVKNKLLLEIPYNKTSIRKNIWGIDFLGYIILPTGTLLRNTTKHKIFINITEKNFITYLGLLKWCNSYELKQKIISKYINKESDSLDT